MKNKTFEQRYNSFHKPPNKWWEKNKPTVMKILLWWIYFPCVLIDKIKNKKPYKEPSVQKIKTFVEKYMPLFVSKTDYGYYLFNNDGFWYYKKIKRKDRKLAKNYRRYISKYILETYEMPGYKKHIYEDSYVYHLEIDFIKENKNNG